MLLVGEAPGKDEDDQGEPFVGRSGFKLEKTLRSVGCDMRRDCWITNANICRPPGNERPDDGKIEACRPILMKAIKELEPKVVVLLGANAVKSLIYEVWKGFDAPMNSWRGHQIPLQAGNYWICPTFHPSYVGRVDDQIVDRMWQRDLEQALELKDRPWPQGPPNYLDQVRVEYDTKKAAATIRKWIQTGYPLSFDLETDRLKPDHPDAKIVSAAVCLAGVETIAFPWHGPVVDAMGELFRSRQAKLGWNTKFEDRWIMRHFGHPIRNWKWCGMIGTHTLDNRSSICSLKFQAFVRLGVDAFNANIDPYFESESANEPNRIHEIDLHELLEYNGLDAALTYEIGRQELEEIGQPFAIKPEVVNPHRLTQKDWEELGAGRARVLRLMMDSDWVDANRIREAAGGSEGLRRLRELREMGFQVLKRRSATESRLFEYKLGDRE